MSGRAVPQKPPELPLPDLRPQGRSARPGESARRAAPETLELNLHHRTEPRIVLVGGLGALIQGELAGEARDVEEELLLVLVEVEVDPGGELVEVLLDCVDVRVAYLDRDE